MKIKNPPCSKGRPRAFDPDAALQSAMRVFWKKGYLGASLTDLTEAMGINRPSLYAAFGNKESLFRKALEQYHRGPACYTSEALKEPTARQVVERMMHGTVEMVTSTCNPGGCLWVHAALSCGDPEDPLRKEMGLQREKSEAELKKRFKRAISEGDLPAGTDIGALARWVVTINFGLSVQAATGATRTELRKVVDVALSGWPGA